VAASPHDPGSRDTNECTEEHTAKGVWPPTADFSERWNFAGQQGTTNLEVAIRCGSARTACGTLRERPLEAVLKRVPHLAVADSNATLAKRPLKVAEGNLFALTLWDRRQKNSQVAARYLRSTCLAAWLRKTEDAWITYLTESPHRLEITDRVRDHNTTAP